MFSIRTYKTTWLLLFLLPVISLFAQTGTITPENLRCNFWENPAGIDVPNPDISWTIKTTGNRRMVWQTAYQILVAGSPALLQQGKGDYWNSGKVASENMLQIPYAGTPLLTSQKYWYKVRIWDEDGNPSPWSQPAHWTMGVLQPQDWTAKWITADGAEKYAPVIEPIKTDFVVHRRNRVNWMDKMPKLGTPNFSSMLLRKEFLSAPKLLRAVVHVCGLGQYELTINGKKVGDYLLTPGWSGYDKTVLYDTYDVTKLISTGANAIGLMLSNGVYNIQPDSVRFVKMLTTYGPLKAIAQLRLEYADGTVKTIGTDNTWQVSPGPVTYMNLYGGEDYDARLEPVGWNRPNFTAAANWANAIDAAPTKAVLKRISCAAPPVKAIEKLKPMAATKLRPDTWVYDLGQNTSVMPEIEISGKPGAYIRIIPAELLKSDGTIDRRSATQDGVKPAWWQYTLGADRTTATASAPTNLTAMVRVPTSHPHPPQFRFVETRTGATEVGTGANRLKTGAAKTEKWFPKFFYQGGRYLQVQLYPAPGDTALPTLKSITGVVVHSAAEAAGTFECSNKLFNRIYRLVRWAQRSNMMSVMTDCPHREKMPWLEQYHLNGPSLRYNFSLHSFFTKAMNDMADAQLDNGFVPNIAPEFFHAGADWKNNGFRNSPEWGSSFIIVPWQQYLFSGDITLMRRYYPKMKNYLSFLDSMSRDNILNIGLGDWYDIGPKPAWGSQLTPVAFTATSIYYYDYLVMSKMAGLTGNSEDSIRFQQKAAAIRQAFNAAFYNAEKDIYATGSNTTCAMPLFFNLVEPQHRQHLLQTLVDSIRQRNNSFTSGEVGYRFLLKALADGGQSNVVYDMNNQSDRPGYGYQLKQGATSLTEKWDAGVGDFGSQNHFMSGQINEWFFTDLAGISVAENGAGFRKTIIKPSVAGDLTWVKGSYQSVSGLISTHWKRSGNSFLLAISIPANTTATIYLPAVSANRIMESGIPAANAKGVKFIKMEDGKAVFEVGSGMYAFGSVME